MFTARHSGTYLVSYSLVAPATGPSALVQTGALKNDSTLVPGSIGALYTGTGSQTTASFYIHLDSGETIDFVGDTTTPSLFNYIPSVNFQLIAFDDGVVYCAEDWICQTPPA
ncbi:hypothetical protein H4J02_11815 [Protaetiibacter sp. SSC-01]|uniref:hypothetical protein n=1 Tax=Protaetiibacter sp. SSC-01 TaxID=2759943 RepID=UPI001657263A|nr:hypothetical protein [Protaetiibacter sp. SSC-01]QNO37128.1 hypothetical protein H4J02_11815 [Protaetiibacter sp. SSC-01]